MSQDIFQALGLQGNPFSPATSTKGYFHTPATQRILEEIHFGVTHRRGFLLLIGEVGVGKTSLLLQLLDQLHSETNGSLSTAWVFNTVMNRTELLHAIATDFGLTPPQSASFSDLLSLLHDFFLRVSSNGGNCAIIVDEAHNLDGATLESLRLLSNLESEERKLVQIVLSGQPELQSRLDQNEFRQLRSRIAISNVLPPLGKKEIKRYVDFKLSSTRSQLALPPRAVPPLWNATWGNVRLINLIMERALHVMYAMGQTRLTPKVVRAGIAEIASFQKDIRVRAVRRRNRWLLIALMIVLAALGAWGWLTGPGYIGSTQPQSEVHQPADPPAAASNEVTKPVEQNSSAGRSVAARIQTDATMTAFLEPFGQTALTPVLFNALQAGTPEVLQARLPEELQLVGLDHLPRGEAAIQYTAFPWQEYTGQTPKWVVLWRPSVRVTQYFPDHVGPEVKKLQKRLKALGFYELPADGYLGSRTWRAITAFQESYGLDMTGTPTPKTVFWLYAGVRPQLPDE